jgi:hypothetical protein
VFAGVALVAVLRPEIRLRLFDKLCLVALTLAGLDTVRNIVWLPLACVVLLPAGLAGWSPESAIRSRLRPVLVVLTIVGAAGIGILAANVSTAKLEKPWPAAQAADVARVAAQHPSWLVLSDAGYADWLLWRYPALKGRISFDIRFELLGASGLKDVVHLEDAAGPFWNRPFRHYRLALWSYEARPELVGALRAEPGTRVLSKHDKVYAMVLPRLGVLGSG